MTVDDFLLTRLWQGEWDGFYRKMRVLSKAARPSGQLGHLAALPAGSRSGCLGSEKKLETD